MTLMGRTEVGLERAAKKLASEIDHGGRVDYVVGDATHPADLERAVSHVEDSVGHLDIVVATVGGSTIVPLLMFEPADFRQDLERNVIAPFLTIKHAVPAMVRAGGGSIVCISSDAADMAWEFMAGYCAGKAGLEGLIRSAALELAKHRIRVNAVRPGLVDVGTERHRGIFDDPETLAQFIEQKPLGRTGRPDDIGAGVRFLAGPESSWITGQSIAIEGGNELKAAPRLERVVRQRWDESDVDAALRGEIPPSSSDPADEEALDG